MAKKCAERGMDVFETKTWSGHPQRLLGDFLQNQNDDFQFSFFCDKILLQEFVVMAGRKEEGEVCFFIPSNPMRSQA